MSAHAAKNHNALDPALYQSAGKEKRSAKARERRRYSPEALRDKQMQLAAADLDAVTQTWGCVTCDPKKCTHKEGD